VALSVILIGVIEARQKERGGGWERNDRLLAVASHARTHAAIRTLNDVPRPLRADMDAFFLNYNALHGKRFEPLGDYGPKRAMRLLDAGLEAFKKRRAK
jgi:inorganic pyrophosphatase